ncbi:MAG: aminotransferase class III-fold pyridoxal phosphate-dependent enzyme [Gemmatimonadaceae bacterium]|nr:aminotransferase class III-fold pyridoxal phosphate-dependent enzyme [Gemmatimonadaceae bacterium]
MSDRPESTRVWREALAESWGMEGVLEPLAGEFDLNFRVTAADGAQFILKVMRPACDPAFVDLLAAAHEYIREHDATVPVPAVVRTTGGERWCVRHDADGTPRLTWLLTLLPGVEYARAQPRPPSLLRELGAAVARMHSALTGFAHPALERPDFKWDLTRADWVMHHIDDLATRAQQELVADAWLRFDAIRGPLHAQPRAVLHNDLNDWNILVARSEHGAPRAGAIQQRGTPCLAGIIDFGDIVTGPLVCELAIAGAYLVLDHPHPERALAAFVAGYHAVSPLTPAQLDLIWPLLLMRLAVSVTNAMLMKRERPDDPYVVVSESLAWGYLERARTIADGQMCARLRVACGYRANDRATRVLAWLDEQRGSFAPVMGIDLATIATGSLAIRSALVPRDAMMMTEDEARSLGSAANAGAAWVGSYGEPRAVYTAPAFRKGAHPIADRRSVHIGVDTFLPAGSPVHAPTAGTVDAVEYRESRLDYGGMVVLRHVTPDGDPFWTLYGHLSRASVESLRPGQMIARGERFGALGEMEENGGWDPHLHFQLAVLTDGMAGDWPGVADPDDLALWTAICPNPAALLNLPDERVAYQALDTELICAGRKAHFATNLKLSYREPLLFVRGWKHYLFDEWGRVHLDAYNNVPHVGHAHPRLAAIAADQLARLNTNTRYLHPLQVAFAEELLARMPPHLTHVFFVNSGSEGNELALRLARTYTGGKDMVTPDHGYHGHTTGAYDLSAYKFNKPNGGGRPEWVQLVPVADTYRGEHRGDDAAVRYAEHVDDAIARIHARGGRLAGFIAETFPSVGGQIIPPVGYLAAVYDRVRAAGGICIADEVQTGIGRLGDFFWGFEHQGARPDIVVLGKPLGNGHPLGAVVTTSEIARSFDNGIEFFSTFGGSTLSCRVGTEVLRIVRDEGLQASARVVGNHLLAGLRELQSRHALIGDVRGMGLFIGVDLVTDRESRAPATAAASYVVNRLREERILIGTEGPADNVLKIRPPLTVGRDDAEWVVGVLGRLLSELQ